MVSNVLKRGLGALNYDRVCQSPGIITFANVNHFFTLLGKMFFTP